MQRAWLCHDAFACEVLFSCDCLWYKAYPNGCQHKCTLLPRPRPYLMRGIGFCMSCMSAGKAQLVGDLLTRQIAPADVNLTGSIPAAFFEPLDDLQVFLVDGNTVSSSKLFCRTATGNVSYMFVRVQGRCEFTI